MSVAVGSLKRLPSIADVANPVQAADIEISKEGRAARVKKVPTEPSEQESEPHQATHIPFPGVVLSLRDVASEGRSSLAKAD